MIDHVRRELAIDRLELLGVSLNTASARGLRLPVMPVYPRLRREGPVDEESESIQVGEKFVKQAVLTGGNEQVVHRRR